MAKESGIGDKLFIDGRDFSGDIGSVQTIRCGGELLVVTGIDQLAEHRVFGKRDGELAFSSWWNTAVGQAHAVLSTLPLTDRILSYLHGAALGGPAASLVAKQGNYDPSRGADGSLAAATQALANGLGLLWGAQHTAGKVTHASAIDVAGVDGGLQGVAITITSSSVANPTVITTATPHGLVTGDSVVIAGHSGSTPSINGEFTVTNTGASTFTIPVNVTSGGTGGTVTKTSTNVGASAFLHVFSVATGTMIGKIQDSADNVTFADLITFAGVNTAGAPSAQMVQTSPTAIVRRYTRFQSTGTFTNAVLAPAVARHFGIAV